MAERFFGVRLSEPIDKLVLRIATDEVEVRKFPDDPGVMSQFGKTLVRVQVSPEAGAQLLVTHDPKLVTDFKEIRKGLLPGQVVIKAEGQESEAEDESEIV